MSIVRCGTCERQFDSDFEEGTIIRDQYFCDVDCGQEEIDRISAEQLTNDFEKMKEAERNQS